MQEKQIHPSFQEAGPGGTTQNFCFCAELVRDASPDVSALDGRWDRMTSGTSASPLWSWPQFLHMWQVGTPLGEEGGVFPL